MAVKARPGRGAAGLAGIAAAIGPAEWLEGRSLLCRCGRVRLWLGAVRSPENSQQLADWYSLSHVVHGLLLYALARRLLSRAGLGVRAVAAAVVEGACEVAENSRAAIDRYRAETVS